MARLFSMVEIEINSNCNRACWYCPNSKYSRTEQGEMKIEVFKSLMEQLKSIDFRGRISYHFYGEPLLCTNLKYYVQITREYLPESRLVLYSNGDLMDKEIVKNLSDAGIDRFVITNHGDVRHNFADVIDNLSGELRSKIEYVQQADLNLTNRGGMMAEISRSIDNTAPCYIPTSLVVVTLMGNLLPCFEDYDQRNVMGNIMETHILDIWNSAKYVEFRETLRAGNRNNVNICRVCNNISVMDEEQFDYVL